VELLANLIDFSPLSCIEPVLIQTSRAATLA
jgi:hypothetical protein